MPGDPINESVASIIYKKINGQDLNSAEETAIRKWMRRSVYYRTLVEDATAEGELKRKLLNAYQEDRFEFWKIVITYRAALHSGMPPRTGNFWKRLLNKFKLKM